MTNRITIMLLMLSVLIISSCNKKESQHLKKESIKNMPVTDKSAAQILGNPDYQAISYGGYRMKTRNSDDQPTLAHIKEDLLLLHAAGIRVLRTYNVQLDHAGNVLQAIKELKSDDPSFEMYVMLGAWIDCLNAWTAKNPVHNIESPQNKDEIARAVAFAKAYPDIVKVIAVGNEAMVKWATSYYVEPNIILKWVNHLQELKRSGELSHDLWITSSDNFASWGGGETRYHTEDLNKLIHAVDFISMHTYPMHDTHYNPAFWGTKPEETKFDKEKQLEAVMNRTRLYAVSQYESVKTYMKRQGANKPIHIGETGWSSYSNELYGITGSRANDEYKEALFYNHMREWTNANQMSCFYFEAFDEQWKDGNNPEGSENFFGLFTIDGRAKFALWDMVDQGRFKGLGRNGAPVTKTFNGNRAELMKTVELPPVKDSIYIPKFNN
ncbi:MAG: glycosyl hydrolase family 17 [Nonlabens sp.]